MYDMTIVATRPLRVAALAALAALAANGSAAVEVQSELDARADCSAASQADMTRCLVDKASVADAALKESRRKARAAITLWYEDAKYQHAATAKLDAADKTYVSYRAAQCAFNRSLGGGAIGNALDMRTLACEVELDLRRADQLDQLTARIRAK